MAQDNAFADGETGLAIRTRHIANADDAELRIAALEGQGDAKHLGVFADLTALQTAHATAVDGSTATVTSPNGNIFHYDAGWNDTGTGFLGDMLKATYDPTGKNNDPRDHANALGLEQITGSIITPAILLLDTDDYNPTGFATCNMIRQDVDVDKLELSGIVAPAVGVSRIIKIANLSLINDLKFMNNNVLSVAANRFLLRDDNDKDLKPNETASFWYDHTSARWRPLSRVG